MQSVLEANDIIGEVKSKPAVRLKTRFFPCPHCGGAAHDEIDGLITVITCIQCGYNRPVRSVYAQTMQR